MPTIKVTVPAGAWSTEEKAKIADGLTSSLASVATDAGKGDIRQYINIQIMEAATGGYAIGGNVVG
ncbi:4-oxalocrotonate tautomerase family protein [Tateyamaria armeniaca]|uniref:4-oxalocrotonate tautomerase family protein n=1 Tax=Tateyamaria armeniaca TaxID=2518930 RepID=A0ABW8UY08_9RHOB